jgi:hypothetical protein
MASKLIFGPHIWLFMLRAVTDVTCRVRAILVLAKRWSPTAARSSRVSG